MGDSIVGGKSKTGGDGFTEPQVVDFERRRNHLCKRNLSGAASLFSELKMLAGVARCLTQTGIAAQSLRTAADATRKYSRAVSRRAKWPRANSANGARATSEFPRNRARLRSTRGE